MVQLTLLVPLLLKYYWYEIYERSTNNSNQVLTFNIRSFITDKETAVQAEPLHKRKRHIKGLKLNKIIWFNNRIKARISWEATKAEEGPKRYYEINSLIKFRLGLYTSIIMT